MYNYYVVKEPDYIFKAPFSVYANMFHVLNLRCGHLWGLLFSSPLSQYCHLNPQKQLIIMFQQSQLRFKKRVGSIAHTNCHKIHKQTNKQKPEVKQS